MRRILMIAYHFPPLAGSSGIQRTLRFVQYLPQFGWEPMVLTTQTQAYERINDGMLGDVPPGTMVERAFALDSARHLAIGGRYPGVFATPDRWMSWRFDAIRRGMALIRKFSPQVIWSTYPIATAHLIGHALHTRSGIPWVADFRDPMAQDNYPADRTVWRAFKRIEGLAMSKAHLALFTTPGAARIYQERYPGRRAKVALLENGYDEDTFCDAEARLPARSPLNPDSLTLLHSGIVYPRERDPSALLDALGKLKRARSATGRLKVRFRAAVHDAALHELAGRFGVQDMIEVLPPIGYREALAEMLCADGLLVLQAGNCNDQIPAKLYEYLRAGRPIIALTDARGDTAATLVAGGVSTIAPLDSPVQIADLLQRFCDAPTSGTIPNPDAVAESSRLRRTATLAALLDDIHRV